MTMCTFKVSKKPNFFNLQFKFLSPPLAAPRGGNILGNIFGPLDLFLYTPLNYFLMTLQTRFTTVSLKATNKWVIHVNCSFYCRFLLQKQKRKLVKPFWKEGRQRHVPSYFSDKNYKKNRYEWLSLLSLGYL